jgi:hypothetical protein
MRKIHLEHFQKYCSHLVEKEEAAVLLGFGFVFAPAFAKATARHAVTGRCGHVPSLSLAKRTRAAPKIPRCRTATAFLQTLRRKFYFEICAVWFSMRISFAIYDITA